MEDFAIEANNREKELGAHADPQLVTELVNTISAKWVRSKETPKQPVLLLMGGFQGSGKTSVTEEIARSVPLITVSSDEIRFLLFQKIPFSEVLFVHTVNATRNRLVKVALQTGEHVVVDLFCTKPRVALFSAMTKNTPYEVLSVYLNASQNILVKRMQDRPKLPGKYKGTLDQLMAGFVAYGEIDKSIYDIILDSGNTTIPELSKIVLERIQQMQQ